MQKELNEIGRTLHKDLVIEECLNEAYFSNSLCWLLNPSSENNRVQFIDAFVELIAKRRAKDKILHKKPNTLKSGRTGKGTNHRNFNFANSHTVREYHLSKSIKGSSQTNYSDLMVFDLDIPNPIVITIENKLFGNVDKLQLKKYHSQCEKKFKEINTREYVIIGIGKTKPPQVSNNKNWIYISWIFDIKPIIEKLKVKSKRVKYFHSVLLYLESVYKFSQNKKFTLYSKIYLDAITNCLLDELNRIKTDKGQWEYQSSSSNKIVIYHSSAKKKKLHIDYITNFNIAIQSHSKVNKPIYEKVCIPFGLNERQLLNHIIVFSKDIYKYHFGVNYRRYLARKHKRNIITNPFPKIDTKVFAVSAENSEVLKHLLKLSTKEIIQNEYE